MQLVSHTRSHNGSVQYIFGLRRTRTYNDRVNAHK
jgi:hypothetical protein